MKLGSKITVGAVCGLALVLTLSFDQPKAGGDTVTIGTCALSAAVGADEQHEFVGTKSCKKCHIKTFKSWENTPHAKAMDLLKAGEFADVKKKFNLDPEKDYTKDEACLGCHTVGFGKKGGYFVPDPEDKKAVKHAGTLENVGCEACHSAGKDYIEVFNDIQKSKRKYTQSELTAVGLVLPDEHTCQGCHNDKSPTFDAEKKFDYAEGLKSGIHQHEELELLEK